MEFILSVFQFIQGLGVAVVMPIVIFILGLCFKTGVGKSLRAGLTVGVGFIGLNLVINSLLGTSLSPAVQEMVTRFGLNLSTIDVGFCRYCYGFYSRINYHSFRISSKYFNAND